MVPAGIVRTDGTLTEGAVLVLHAVSAVSIDVLENARIRSARKNWLHAPWYPYRRGGAITIGRTIYLTRIYFDRTGHGDDGLAAMWQWLVLLAHEVGHLPQAERSGLGPIGIARYIGAFIWQYGSRALLFRHPIHDGSPMEREADKGRWVILQLLSGKGARERLLKDLQIGDVPVIKSWCSLHAGPIARLSKAYDDPASTRS